MFARFGRWLGVCAGVLALPAVAQQVSEPVVTPQVLITASQSDTSARRDFVAGKIIISRKRIEESGAETVADLLKREPAVSVDAEGRIGLLGLPGYTQVLVDGEAPPAGKGPHQLNLVHIEKIEIVKSAVAEYGPFGIAGTINIITRKTRRKTSTQLGLIAHSAGSHPGASATLSHNQSSPDSPLRLGANLSAKYSRPVSERQISLSSVKPGQDDENVWRGAVAGRGRSKEVDASGELTWDPGAGASLRLSPNGGQYTTDELAHEQRRYANGGQVRVRSASRSVFSMASLPLGWTIKPAANSQLEVKARVSRIGMESSELRTETGDGQPAVRSLSQDATSHVKSVDLAYKAKLGKAHDVKLGASAMNTRETIDYGGTVNGQEDRALDILGTQRRALSRQLRVFAQDDWRLSDTLAMNGGLSGQHTAIDIAEGSFGSKARFQVWSPSVHLVKSLDEDDERQVRLSLARTYRAPSRDELASRPRINPMAPCDAIACGTNTIDTFDSAGNQNLDAERALGLNLAYEHGLGGNSTLTAEVYARRIGNKIGIQIGEEDVAWSGLPRFVARPVNLGDAWVRGLNLEMELALRDLSKSAPQMNLRGSVNFAASRVSHVPGPDNRLEKQTPWSAKLGGSYTLRGWPLKFQLDANWSPGVWIRTGQLQRIAIARRVEFDSSLAWTFAPGRRLQLSVADTIAHSARTIYEYSTAQGQLRAQTDQRTYRSVSLRFDTNL